MIRIRIGDDVPMPEIAQALIRVAEQIADGEDPTWMRDINGNTIGFVEMDLRETAETEETVTFIAGQVR
jgi:hypothetical protein